MLDRELSLSMMVCRWRAYLQDSGIYRNLENDAKTLLVMPSLRTSAR